MFPKTADQALDIDSDCVCVQMLEVIVSVQASAVNQTPPHTHTRMCTHALNLERRNKNHVLSDTKTPPFSALLALDHTLVSVSDGYACVSV